MSKSSDEFYAKAEAHWRAFEQKEAIGAIFRSFFSNPLSFLNKQRATMMAKILIGSILRCGIPVNGLTRPLFNILYKLHVFIRETLIYVLRFFYTEPLFRSQCVKVGKRFWMEHLPYIVGNGKITIGDFVRLSGKCGIGFTTNIYPEPKLHIGDYTFIGHDVRFAIAQEITIGDHCYIAGAVTFADNDGHPLDYMQRRSNVPPVKENVRPVIIGNDVWIGREAVILKGVTVGDRAVIGTRSIVTENVPADTVVAGNPAKTIKKLA